MAKVVMDVEVKTESAINNVDDLKDSIEDVGKETQNVAEESSEMGNQLDSAAGGAITKFKGLVGTLGGVVKSFKTLRGAIIATGIGALILAIGAVGAAFTNSEEGQNKFSKIMMQIGVVTGNVIDILANLGKGILSLTKIFSDPTAALQGFKDGIGDAVNGIKNFNEETKKEIKLAGELADQYAEADRAERALLVSRAKANRDRAELLEKAIDKENFTTVQRIKFLEEAGALEEKITNQEIQAARLRFEAKQQENTLSGSTKEDLLEEEQLRARLIDLETAKLTKAKEVTSQTIALKAEEAAALKAIEDQKIADQNQADLDEITRLQTLADEKKRIAEEETKFQQQKDQAIAISKANMQNILTGLEDTGIKKTKAGQALYKAIAITQIGLDSAVAISKASTLANAEGVAAQTAFPFVPGIGTIARVLSYASTVAQVGSNIARAKQLLSGGGSASVSTGDSSAPTQAPGSAQQPQFNIVGQGEGSQIASALGEQQQQPVQAFVVSQDVTTAQSLENGIIQGATLGG